MKEKIEEEEVVDNEKEEEMDYSKLKGMKMVGAYHGKHSLLYMTSDEVESKVESKLKMAVKGEEYNKKKTKMKINLPKEQLHYFSIQ